MALRAKVRVCRDCRLPAGETWFPRGPGARCGPCRIKRSAARRQAKAAAPRRRARPAIPPSAPDPRDCPAHLAWIRTLPCLCCTVPGAVIHAHHVRTCTDGGTGLKPHDRWAVPLCPAHHLELHQRGARTFEAKYRVDLRAKAEGLAAASPFLDRSDPDGSASDNLAVSSA